MISKTIRHIRIPRRTSYPIINIAPIRFSSTKVLKPSSFAFPSDVPPPPPPPPSSSSPTSSSSSSSSSTIQVGNLADDFKLTKLIRGKTDLKLAISQRASDKLNQIMQEEKNTDSGLSIKVESGGCHGFQYNLKLIDVTKESNEDEFIFERDGGKVVLDESSLMILQDSIVDYTKELIGSQFKIVDSPYTTSSCGCGSSFDFDFEKLESKSK